MARWSVAFVLCSALLARGADPAAAQPASVPTGASAGPTAAPAIAAAPVAPPASGGQAVSFADAVAAAEKAAESVDVAHADVERAEASVELARAGYLPNVTGTSSYQRTLASEFDHLSFGGMMSSGDGLGDLPFGKRNNWRLGLNVTQPLFDGFKTVAAMRQAKAGVRVSELGVKAARAQVVLFVAQSYLDAVLAQRQVEIAQTTLQQAEQTLSETQLGFKQGATPEFDLVRAEVARDNQKNLLVQFQVQADVALVQLRRLIGLPPGAAISLTSRLDTDDVEAVVAAAQAAGVAPAKTRVAVAQAKETVEVRKAAVDVAKADRLPTLTATTDYGLVNYENQPFNTDWRTNWTLGVAISLPIFDGFRRRAAIDTNKALLHSARAQLQQAGEVAGVESEQAAASVTASQTQLDNSKRTVQQAQRAYEIAELRFQQGASTHLELVDTRVQLEQALLTQARSARDLRVARLRQELLPSLPLGTFGAF